MRASDRKTESQFNIYCSINETNEGAMSTVIRMRDQRQVEDEAEERILIATSMNSYDGSLEEIFQGENGAERHAELERFVKALKLFMVNLRLA